jgi:hypothetical protein
MRLQGAIALSKRARELGMHVLERSHLLLNVRELAAHELTHLRTGMGGILTE